GYAGNQGFGHSTTPAKSTKRVMRIAASHYLPGFANCRMRHLDPAIKTPKSKNRTAITLIGATTDCRTT
ncbi:MAG TPA: hypothetical protein PLI12_09015, partial [Acetobacteraceae bacterium]|nr:hypothetical protein [Acetobacteraceae bacterium]